MELAIANTDPLRVLLSTKRLVEKPRFVTIDHTQIPKIAKIVKRKIDTGLETSQEGFGTSGSLESNMQLIFLEDCVNFCFWPDTSKPRWQVEWPKGVLVKGGWYGLAACFQRAIHEKKPILDALFLASFSLQDTKSFFRSANETEIPLLSERVNILQGAGAVLSQKFEGQAINLLEEAQFDAIAVVRLLLEEFPSFRDISSWRGTNIYFLKRAQIFAYDASILLKEVGKRLQNTDLLTAFADYKLPQMLRFFGMLHYTKDLAGKIDHGVSIPKDSREELEIRAATIWAVELIRQYIQHHYTAAQIDNALWLLSQETSDSMPAYHRTRTIYY